MDRMDRISAAGNLTIEHNIDHWRLLSISNGQERTLLEAETGKPVSYIEIFGSKRRLPKGGGIQEPLAVVERIDRHVTVRIVEHLLGALRALLPVERNVSAC